VIGRVSDRLLWEKANFHIRGGEKLAIIGSNGTGKTTLVKKMIHQEEGIFISPSVKIGYISQNLNIVDGEKSILENVSSTSHRDESFIRTILARLHFYRDVFIR
jgi:pleuromutilin/lincosamide/streptogramin A transport system ATP-binding/permease protein